ncbi:energy transducer TonB [Yoonia sp. BS5-3]|uniref:Energy transducer TonB n=1 Tax=Yoonia phaeophyticola TaxID=3137369 RepID=A0ABZ2V3A0_9RHOB
MRTTGTTVSAIGHAGLIGWLILGWGFDAEPLEFSTTTVTVISGEEFEQAQAASTPDPGAADPATPTPPEVDVTPPSAPAAQEPPDPTPLPDPVEPPAEDTPPPSAPVPPAPADVSDDLPIEPPAPVTPPPTPDVEISDRPTPRPAERITSQPNDPPPPDASVDDIVRESVAPDDDAPADIVAEEQDPTAPEASAPEIAIADEEPSTVLETSMRPQVRPSRPEPPAPEQVAEVADTQEPVEPTEPDTNAADAAAEALAEALAEATAEPAAEAPAADPGPPMSGAERDSFRIAVNGCWNVDPGSVASRVTVEVGFNLDRNGLVQGDVRLISSNGDQASTNTAFEAARRAILRCQSGGYQLPAEKYEQWKEVVITFDPSGMRLR